ncbi:MAG TPA: hypothetical protein VK979_05380 [Guyparkeria sp.]|nr:hypothetical protein [Guyparkeria sp.]
MDIDEKLLDDPGKLEAFRKHLIGIARTIKPASRDEYIRIGRRWWPQIKQGKWPHQHRQSKGQWHPTRSGVRYYAAARAVGIIDKLRNGEISDADRIPALNTLKLVGEVIKTYPSNQPNPNAQPIYTQPKASKWRDLTGLPPNWRDQIWAAATRPRAKDRRDEISALALTGARPEELEKGIHFTLRDDGSIRARVEGAKYRPATKTEPGRGQEWRGFTIADPGNSVEGNHLLQRLLESDGQITITGPEPKIMCDYTRRCAAAAFPRRAKIEISPYSYRHAFIARAKAQGLTDIEIAQIAGHQSTDSARHYGRARQAKLAGGGGRISEIQASDPVREIDRSWAERTFGRGAAELDLGLERGDDLEW